jgi:hypothetical protein
MKRVFWDLDGVLRDICTLAFGNNPNSWHYRDKYGKSIVDIIEEDLCILTNSPPTEYFDYIVNNFSPLYIVTNQKKHWKPFTWQWLHEYMVDMPFEVTYHKPEDKLLFIEDNILVEDYPFFKDYTNIILIDREYNKETKASVRVRNIKELDKAIKDSLT